MRFILMRVNQSLIIDINQKLDFIPVISTITAISNLITKIALDIFSCIKNVPSNDYFKDHPYLNYINNKNYLVILLLSIPGFNIVIASIAKKDSIRETTEANANRETLKAFRTSSLELQSFLKQFTEQSVKDWNALDLDRLYNKIEEIHQVADQCFSTETKLQPAYDMIVNLRSELSTTPLRANLKVEKQLEQLGHKITIREKILVEVTSLIKQLKEIEASLDLANI